MGKHVWAAALMALAVIVGLGVPPGRIAEARTLEKDDLLGVRRWRRRWWRRLVTGLCPAL
uniref:Uncharacterized protein n=1 Tax=Zea mays TaxID=4577 RepID=B6U675_MAIZE|nr:hypothetical protein [Zea mays]